VATDENINKVLLGTGLAAAPDALKDNVYSYSQRTGGKSTTTMQSATDSAAAEITRPAKFKEEYKDSKFDEDFESPIDR
jgi:hypothetical protein